MQHALSDPRQPELASQCTDHEHTKSDSMCRLRDNFFGSLACDMKSKIDETDMSVLIDGTPGTVVCIQNGEATVRFEDDSGKSLESLRATSVGVGVDLTGYSVDVIHQDLGLIKDFAALIN